MIQNLQQKMDICIKTKIFFCLYCILSGLAVYIKVLQTGILKATSSAILKIYK